MIETVAYGSIGVGSGTPPGHTTSVATRQTTGSPQPAFDCQDEPVRDYYETVAQVLPVLLLALVFDSGYLERLKAHPRRLRRDDPSGGVRFWTKPRVRIYALFLAAVVLVDTGSCVLMLAGGIPDSIALRVLVACGMGIALASLLFRIAVHIIEATGDEPDRATGPGPDR